MFLKLLLFFSFGGDEKELAGCFFRKHVLKNGWFFGPKNEVGVSFIEEGPSSLDPPLGEEDGETSKDLNGCKKSPRFA